MRFIEEAQITGQLQHPNIVPVYELGVDEHDQVFYTMKLVEGITLKKVLELLRAEIPATVEGVRATEQAIYEGINVNVTLLFAVSTYEKVAEAYLRGLERRLRDGKSLDVRSVASFPSAARGM